MKWRICWRWSVDENPGSNDLNDPEGLKILPQRVIEGPIFAIGHFGFVFYWKRRYATQRFPGRDRVD